MIDMFGLPYTMTTTPNDREGAVYSDEYTDEDEISLEDLQDAYNLTKEQAQEIWDKYDKEFRKGTEK